MRLTPQCILRRISPILLAVAAAAALPARVSAQQPPAATPQPPAPPTPEIGTMAPDFTLPGATRFGVLRDPVRLSDFRGQTVVLAFFIRARTKG